MKIIQDKDWRSVLSLISGVNICIGIIESTLLNFILGVIGISLTTFIVCDTIDMDKKNGI